MPGRLTVHQETINISITARYKILKVALLKIRLVLNIHWIFFIHYYARHIRSLRSIAYFTLQSFLNTMLIKWKNKTFCIYCAFTIPILFNQRHIKYDLPWHCVSLGKPFYHLKKWMGIITHLISSFWHILYWNIFQV